MRRLLNVALVLFAMFVSMAVMAGTVSAVKVVSVVRRATTLFKAGKKTERVVDGAQAIKNGKKIYRALDIAEDAVRIGKGMLGKLSDSVADDVVEECARLIKSGKAGSMDEVGTILGKIFKNPNLTKAERDLLLNDAYLRIAQRTGSISASEADEAFRLLKNTDGLHALVRKCCTQNPSKASGHLYELRQAIAFQKDGFDVLGVGVSFSDGIKSRATDLDLLVQKGNRLFLVESKHYSTGFGHPDVIRADAESLINLKAFLNGELGNSVDVTPIFTFVTEPKPLLVKQLQIKGIPYFVGESQDLVAALGALY